MAVGHRPSLCVKAKRILSIRADEGRTLFVIRTVPFFSLGIGHRSSVIGVPPGEGNTPMSHPAARDLTSITYIRQLTPTKKTKS